MSNLLIESGHNKMMIKITFDYFCFRISFCVVIEFKAISFCFQFPPSVSQMLQTTLSLPHQTWISKSPVRSQDLTLYTSHQSPSMLHSCEFHFVHVCLLTTIIITVRIHITFFLNLTPLSLTLA